MLMMEKQKKLRMLNSLLILQQVLKSTRVPSSPYGVIIYDSIQVSLGLAVFDLIRIQV